MKYFLFSISLLFLFTGCGQKMVLNYAPSSTMVVKGNLDIGEFDYLPVQIHNVLPNQIRNTAIGNIIFEKNISVYYRNALFNESRLVGININGDNKISGEIKDFLIDDLGYSIDWKLLVNYKILTKDNKLCFNKDKLIEKNTAKFLNPFGTLNEIIKLNIEKLFEDNEFKKCIN